MSDRPEGAHESFGFVDNSAEAVERVWRTFWLPLITEDVPGKGRQLSVEKLKGELFSCHHLIMTAPRVYMLVTGNMLGDPCASFEAVQAEHKRHLAELLEVAQNEAVNRALRTHNLDR